MKQLNLSVYLACATMLLLGSAALTDVYADSACARKAFKTEMYRNACQSGGQAAAKKAAKKFMAQAKKTNHISITCSTCHNTFAPKYTLKQDGLAKFQQWGGR